MNASSSLAPFSLRHRRRSWMRTQERIIQKTRAVWRHSLYSSLVHPFELERGLGIFSASSIIDTGFLARSQRFDGAPPLPVLLVLPVLAGGDAAAAAVATACRRARPPHLHLHPGHNMALTHGFVHGWIHHAPHTQRARLELSCAGALASPPTPPAHLPN